MHAAVWPREAQGIAATSGTGAGGGGALCGACTGVLSKGGAVSTVDVGQDVTLPAHGGLKCPCQNPRHQQGPDLVGGPGLEAEKHATMFLSKHSPASSLQSTLGARGGGGGSL